MLAMPFQQFAHPTVRVCGNRCSRWHCCVGPAQRRPHYSAVGSWRRRSPRWSAEARSAPHTPTPATTASDHLPDKTDPRLQQVLPSHLPRKGPGPPPLQSLALFRSTLLQASASPAPTQNSPARRKSGEQCGQTEQHGHGAERQAWVSVEAELMPPKVSTCCSQNL